MNEGPINGETAMKTQKLLTAVLILQGLILANQWLGSPVSTALAQIPDAGAQRNEIIDQLKNSNEKLDKVIDILSGGTLQVQVAKPDDTQQKK
jgi:hypothetical protein